MKLKFKLASFLIIGIILGIFIFSFYEYHEYYKRIKTVEVKTPINNNILIPISMICSPNRIPYTANKKYYIKYLGFIDYYSICMVKTSLQLAKTKYKNIAFDMFVLNASIWVSILFDTKENIIRIARTGYFGHMLLGYEKASRYYFKKESSDLNIAEGTYLALIMNDPSLGNNCDIKALKSKKNLIFIQMKKWKHLADNDYLELYSKTGEEISKFNCSNN